MDASQSFGLLDIDIKKCKADFIVFAGHKTLYGPLGAAGFVDNATVPLDTFIVGGTGSESLNLDMPKQVPERYEAASKNIVAIAGLHEALSVVDRNGNYQKEKLLSEYVVEKLKKLKNTILYIPENLALHIGVISFNVKGYKATKCSEKKMSKAVARLTYAFANATVPKVNVITQKAYGSAYVAMNSKAIGADITMAWPDAEIGTMEAKLAAKIICDGQGSEAIDACAKEYAALQTSANSAAKRGYVDQIVTPEDTRKYVIGAFEMLYTKQEDGPAKKHGTV